MAFKLCVKANPHLKTVQGRFGILALEIVQNEKKTKKKQKKTSILNPSNNVKAKG